ncbi:hypothetical protein [Nostoc sp. FACHB-133]|uniref:hypothetical protein n=1 Tax=Nostoc sp. FACHB-133 TaxID=2692835 RepID=UPI001688707E|nr:hypothetical protein [Nostoc sp. FACHB-133]MBD2521543.1 hypothetical protein [Nostoc sp. FACHB-133]
MNGYFESNPQPWEYFPRPPKKKQDQLLRVFWIIALGLFAFEIFFNENTSLLSKAGAILITIASLVPSYLWCSGRAHGMPIFPFFALTFLWTYALPLVSNHPTVMTYSPSSHLFAGLTVAGFLGLGTLVWFRFVKSIPPMPKFYRSLNIRKGINFFLFILITSVLFNVYSNAGWLESINGGTIAVVRGTILGLTALGVFVLSYQLGKKELSKLQARLFILFLIANLVTSTVALLLVSASSISLLAIISFVISRKKIPIISIIILLVILNFLHYGKGEMRAKYWFAKNSSCYVQPWNYPAWYSEWIGYSLTYINRNKSEDNLPSNSEEKASFVERSSVIQMLLLAQDKSPDRIPYLYGATYAILPELLVPRILNSNKIRSHEGTSILNVHYKLQTYEQSVKTTIGWGLLAESYANFGLIGCGGLAIILGAAYGKATRWSMNAPILSFQSLFAVLMMSYSFQSEFSAGVYVAALFQSSTTIAGISLVLMKKQRVSRHAFQGGQMN